MTVSEKHAEWISLLEVSGSFLAVAVLEEAFPQGLDKVTTPFRQRIRSAYDEWRDAVDESDPQIEAIHREWLSLVIRDFLEHDDSILKSAADLPASLLYHDVQSDSTFRPDLAVMAGDKAKLLISVTPPNTDLENPLPSESWLASPAERLIALCRTSGVSVGLVTNGERWMVVSVPADGGSSRASWYARLWFQEPVTLQAFYSLLGVRRCFGQEDQTLEALLQKSLGHQDEITDTLGEQVRRAVEVLVQALDRADLDRNRTLLKDVTPEQLFEAGLTVMMRLVVLLCAEERGLLLLGEPVYDQNYAVSSLRSQLVQQANHGLEILERREDAWSRLLATFRGVYGGISHETLRLPPLGGSLFDPDRFPFLEGRDPGTCWRDTAAIPLPIDNRTVLLLLNALQVLEHKSGAQLLSYESLDVEQIGHVYEGLLERTVKRVPDVTLGLVANSAVRKKTGHPELLLSELEHVTKTGKDNLRAFLFERTGRSKSAITNDLSDVLTQKDSHRLLTACSGDLTLMERIKPFGNLIRTDSWGDPLVYRERAFIVTHGAGRRETGSHYTPKSLTEPIVKHTLEPLAYAGPAEGKPREEWKLKSPIDLLALKICDMAMGSGAFLVQTCRYLAERLVEAWNVEEQAGRVISIEGVVLDKVGEAELLPRDQAERVLIARRLVASRCLYGVDINPMAVELAKLSLWLITMMRSRPFSFLDHALKCGDSLLGVSHIKQLERFSLRDPDNAQPLLETANLWRQIDLAAALRRELEATPSHTAAQIAEKSRLHFDAETQVAKLRAAADLLIAAELDCPTAQGWGTRRAVAASEMQAAWEQSVFDLKHLARIKLNGSRAFHWPIEYPELFSISDPACRETGFDAFVGNPPFLGGKRISTVLGTAYERQLKTCFESSKGAADLCSYFFRRAYQFMKLPSCFGLLATNSISEADTREAGLEYLIKHKALIFRADVSVPWPGAAGVAVSIIHITRGHHQLRPLLNGRPVAIISAFLDDEEGKSPCRLMGNSGKYTQGPTINGDGFIISKAEHDSLIAVDPKSAEVLCPYLNGDLLNNLSSFLNPEVYVINFQNWPLDKASQYKAAFRVVNERVRPKRETLTKQIHETRFWLHWDRREGFFNRYRDTPRWLAATITTKHLAFSFIEKDWYCSHAIKLFAISDYHEYGVLQSSVHEIWARKYSSQLETRLRYSTSDAFDTFVFPFMIEGVRQIGELYDNFREKLKKDESKGITELYNAFHDIRQTGDRIIEFRRLHRQLDTAVAAAYGWADYAANEGAALRHDFHPTKQGIRWTFHPEVRRDILDRLLALNYQRFAEEVATGMHDKKSAKKKHRVMGIQHPELALEAVKPMPTPARTKLESNVSESSRSSSDVEQSELLNAIFTCTARREVTDRDDLVRQVVGSLGFKRLSSNLREVIASGINSAIRRGLVGYNAQNIHRIAARYAELDNEVLVNAINASIRPGCVYTLDEVLHMAAKHLGCQRLKEAFHNRLESALTAASRRGILTKRGDEIRKAF